jgi:hypothetical protein
MLSSVMDIITCSSVKNSVPVADFLKVQFLLSLLKKKIILSFFKLLPLHLFGETKDKLQEK